MPQMKSPSTRGIDHEWALVGGARIAAWSTMRGAMGTDDSTTEMAARTGPWSGGRRQSIRQMVGGFFVVDPPPMEIRPRLLGAALDGKTVLFEHRDRRFELMKLQLDRIVGLWVEVDLPAKRCRNSIGQRETHPKTESGLGRRRCGAQGQLHRGGVEYGEQTNEPREPRVG